MSGCTTTTKYQAITVTVEIPPALRTCAGIPNRPSGEYTQREVAQFISRLSNAHGDCKTKLNEVVNLVDRQNQNAINVRNQQNKK